MARLRIVGYLLLLGAGCGDDAASDPSVVESTDAGSDRDSGAADAGAERIPLAYEDESMWVCLPGAAEDHCATAQVVEEWKADGTTEALPPLEETDPEIDCFYVYPTVALGVRGNVEDFENLPDILDPVLQHLAPLRDLCRTFAPLYRQARIGSYFGTDTDTYLDAGYEDVADAFGHYMAEYNEGRDFILMGHSQGAHQLRRLLQRKFDDSPELQSQLRVALLLGPLGDVVVPTGKLKGGSFENIPLCSAQEETGCVITFNTFGAPALPGMTYGRGIADGQDTACTNPVVLGGSGPLRGARLPLKWNQSMFDPGFTLDTDADFVRLRDFYSAECKQNDAGLSYLHISVMAAADDERADPMPYYDLDGMFNFGLHLVEVPLLMEDLRAQIEARL